jgi:exosortase
LSRVDRAIVLLLILIWIPGMLELGEVWARVEYASHGFLVPVVALWAATAHREALARIEPTPLPGGRLILAALAPVYLASLVFGNPTLLGVVAVATVAAAVLALRGVRWLMTLRFPLAYLLFMVPLPVAWVTPVIVKLQLWVSQAAVELLQSQGVAIYREGNVLVLPGDVELFVAEACSGITSLITLIPIGVFIAYFTDVVLWRRVALVVAVVPIALAGNLLRVILTVWLSIEVSVGFATSGPLHEWAGVLTYVIGCLALLGVGVLLRRFGPAADTVPSA